MKGVASAASPLAALMTPTASSSARFVACTVRWGSDANGMPVACCASFSDSPLLSDIVMDGPDICCKRLRSTILGYVGHGVDIHRYGKRGSG